MSIRAFIVFILIFGFLGCESVKKPDNLISKKKMINILIDARLIASANGANRKTMEKNGVFVNEYIYKKYNIDSLQFAESNAYYVRKLSDYEDIYLKVKDSIDSLTVKYEGILQKETLKLEKIKADSIEVNTGKRNSMKFSAMPSEDFVKKKDKDAKIIEPASNN